MSTLKKATVEFDKNSKEGVVNIKLSTELLECHDRLALTAKFKEEVEPVLTEEGYTWSSLFKVTQVPIYNSGHKWLEFDLDLVRQPKPFEWDEGLYKDQLVLKVRHLCQLVDDHVDYIEKELLRNKLPEVNETIQFVKV